MNKKSSFVRYDLPIIIRMLLPTLFIVGVGLHYREFVREAVMANKAINAGILFTALTGVVVILYRLIDMQRDMSALDRFYREAQASGDMQKLMDSPWLKGRAVRHYLENLAHTEGTIASQLDQDAIHNELEAFAEEYNSKLEFPQFLVGFMIAMGLLGTFIGLLETLTGISGMLDGMGHGGDIQKEFSKLVVELRKPLSGMGIAFSASMFGLVTSLQLSIMMIMLRRYMSRVMEKARSVMHKLLTRIKTAAPVPQQPAQFLTSPTVMPLPMNVVGGGVISRGGGDATFLSASDTPEEDEGQTRSGSSSAPTITSDKLSDAYFRSQDAITSMANSVNILTKRMDAILRTLEENIEVSKKTNNLLSFGPRMTEINEQMTAEIKSVVNAQTENQKLMQKIIGSLIQIDQSLMSNNTKDIVLSQREATSVLNEMFSTTQTHTRLFSELLEDHRIGTSDLLQALKTLSEKLSKQESVNLGSSRHLFEIKENFQKAVASFALIDTVAESIGKQTLLVEASIAEERSSQVALVASIQRELRSFTDGLRQALGGQSGE